MSVSTNNKLRVFVDRIEVFERSKQDLTEDIRDVYTEAKLNGFDVKALRALIKLRKQDVEEVAEHEALLAAYMSELGMGPLFEHAAEQAQAAE